MLCISSLWVLWPLFQRTLMALVLFAAGVEFVARTSTPVAYMSTPFFLAALDQIITLLGPSTCEREVPQVNSYIRPPALISKSPEDQHPPAIVQAAKIQSFEQSHTLIEPHVTSDIEHRLRKLEEQHAKLVAAHEAEATKRQAETRISTAQATKPTGPVLNDDWVRRITELETRPRSTVGPDLIEKIASLEKEKLFWTRKIEPLEKLSRSTEASTFHVVDKMIKEIPKREVPWYGKILDKVYRQAELISGLEREFNAIKFDNQVIGKQIPIKSEVLEESRKIKAAPRKQMSEKKNALVALRNKLAASLFSQVKDEVDDMAALCCEHCLEKTAREKETLKAEVLRQLQQELLDKLPDLVRDEVNSAAARKSTKESSTQTSSGTNSAEVAHIDSTISKDDQTAISQETITPISTASENYTTPSPKVAKEDRAHPEAAPHNLPQDTKLPVPSKVNSEDAVNEQIPIRNDFAAPELSEEAVNIPTAGKGAKKLTDETVTEAEKPTNSLDDTKGTLSKEPLRGESGHDSTVPSVAPSGHLAPEVSSPGVKSPLTPSGDTLLRVDQVDKETPSQATVENVVDRGISGRESVQPSTRDIANNTGNFLNQTQRTRTVNKNRAPPPSATRGKFTPSLAMPFKKANPELARIQKERLLRKDSEKLERMLENAIESPNDSSAINPRLAQLSSGEVVRSPAPKSPSVTDSVTRTSSQTLPVLTEVENEQEDATPEEAEAETQQDAKEVSKSTSEAAVNECPERHDTKVAHGAIGKAQNHWAPGKDFIRDIAEEYNLVSHRNWRKRTRDITILSDSHTTIPEELKVGVGPQWTSGVGLLCGMNASIQAIRNLGLAPPDRKQLEADFSETRKKGLARKYYTEHYPGLYNFEPEISNESDAKEARKIEKQTEKWGPMNYTADQINSVLHKHGYYLSTVLQKYVNGNPTSASIWEYPQGEETNRKLWIYHNINHWESIGPTDGAVFKIEEGESSPSSQSRCLTPESIVEEGIADIPYQQKTHQYDTTNSAHNAARHDKFRERQISASPPSSAFSDFAFNIESRDSTGLLRGHAPSAAASENINLAGSLKTETTPSICGQPQDLLQPPESQLSGKDTQTLQPFAAPPHDSRAAMTVLPATYSVDVEMQEDPEVTQNSGGFAFVRTPPGLESADAEMEDDSRAARHCGGPTTTGPPPVSDSADVEMEGVSLTVQASGDFTIGGAILSSATNDVEMKKDHDDDHAVGYSSTRQDQQLQDVLVHTVSALLKLLEQSGVIAGSATIADSSSPAGQMDVGNGFIQGRSESCSDNYTQGLEKLKLLANTVPVHSVDAKGVHESDTPHETNVSAIQRLPVPGITPRRNFKPLVPVSRKQKAATANHHHVMQAKRLKELESVKETERVKEAEREKEAERRKAAASAEAQRVKSLEEIEAGFEGLYDSS